MKAISLLLEMMETHQKNFEQLEKKSQKIEFVKHMRNIFQNLKRKYGEEEIEVVPEHNQKFVNVSALPLVGYA